MFNESQLTFETVQYMDENGEILNQDKVAAIDPNLVLDMYKWMLKARLIDEKLLRMQRQGRIGTYAPFSGQEAAQIGSAFALDKNDWMAPSYRDLAAALVHGLPLEQVLRYVKGHLYGGKTPEDVNVLPIQIIIAAQTLHAMGVAFAAKIKKESSVSISYFGDGATSEGDFHEALNFAAVYKLPVIFFSQNNQYAISVPLKQQMASKTIAQKAIAYGMDGIRVDGNDLFAVYGTMKEAVEKVRNQEGPVLIEAVTYRLGPHTTADDPTKYRNQADVEQWLKKDPLLRVKKYLNDKNLWNDEKEEAFKIEVEEELEAVIERQEQEVVPTIDESFNYVYGTMYNHLEEQRQETIELQKQTAGENNG